MSVRARESNDFPCIALTGNPNSGKTALFNALTGGRQKVANYPGVTVERKEGSVKTPSGLRVTLLDLPGTYSLFAQTPDEKVTRDVLLGNQTSQTKPQVLIAVVDATNLERHLSLVLELKELSIPVVLALNMMDLATLRGLELDLEVLSKELGGIPVIPTVAIQGKGVRELLEQIEFKLKYSHQAVEIKNLSSFLGSLGSLGQTKERFVEVDRILKLSTKKTVQPEKWTKRIDDVVLHPIWGVIFLLTLLLFIFQSVFNFASFPQDWIETQVQNVGQWISGLIGPGPLQGLVVDGVIAGVGSVLVFLPQILILFSFILFLEDSGYMARAAFLVDRLMKRVGLNGKAFIPLLSSYACAIPGIMATRTIADRRDRLITILIAPLTTCSARLPVYTLLIGAFIPNTKVLGPLYLQGLVMFVLYGAGIFLALLMALILRKTTFPGPRPALLLELPDYKLPSIKNIFIGLIERAKVFLRRAGTVILSLSILVWFLSSYPKAPSDAGAPAIYYSYAGMMGRFLEPIFLPLGFNWRIVIALIPGFAAREVMVSALATVYAVEMLDENSGGVLLSNILVQDWSIPTALSLLVWYIIAPQCLSTLAVTRRETNSWRWPFFMFFYLSLLAYLASLFTYQLARWLL